MLNSQINVRISKEDYLRLKKIADEQDRSPAYIARQAIRLYIEGASA